jgi:hypothetical protein
MIATLRYQRCGVVLLAICLAASRGAAGSLEGFVKDAGKMAGSDGLDAVEVRLMPKQGEAVKKTTDADGYYQFTEVTNGEYRLEFDRVGYSPRPREIRKQDVKDGKTLLGDVILYRTAGTDAYFTIAAGKVLARVRASNSTPDAYRDEWNSLRRTNLDPVLKARLAQAISQIDPRARDLVPGLRAYASLDVKDVEGLNRSFQEALFQDKDIPTQGTVADLKVNDEVTAEIVLYHIRSKAASEEQRVRFHQRFESTWKGTGTADLVKELYVLDTAPSPRLIPRSGPTGTWKWTVNINGEERVGGVLKLKADGDKLTGQLFGRDNEEIQITDGTYKDGELSFKITPERDGQKFTVKYTGKVKGDTIKGKTQFERDGQTLSRDWEAKRSDD